MDANGSCQSQTSQIPPSELWPRAVSKGRSNRLILTSRVTFHYISYQKYAWAYLNIFHILLLSLVRYSPLVFGLFSFFFLQRLDSASYTSYFLNFVLSLSVHSKTKLFRCQNVWFSYLNLHTLFPLLVTYLAFTIGNDQRYAPICKQVLNYADQDGTS